MRRPDVVNKNLRPLMGDRTRGLGPLVGVAGIAAWGNPPAPAFPSGGTGKGDSGSLSPRQRGDH